jgi:dihydrolipoamide dehydrogenase
VCVGRSPVLTGLGLEDLGIKLENSRMVIDGYLKTNLANIYAAGDCSSKVMLAHYAAYQGRMAVENMVFDNKHKADNSVVPVCVFTEPQIASVGLSEENSLAQGLSIKVHKFDFRASAMARIIDQPTGFIKVISNQETQKIIGGCIIGPQASELIATLCVAVSAQLSVSQIRAMIFAHPTLAELLQETISS